METELVGSSVQRDYRIDFLRGLSILSVLLLHFNLAYKLLKSPLGKLLPDPYLSNIVWNGNYGVTVFFVISGYLITSTSLRRFGSLGAVSAKAFYSLRFARIFPCLLLVLALISGLALAGVEIFRDERNVPLWLADLSILTFWHNVLMARFGYFNYCLNILWSLSVEEVFYLAFPLLCLVLCRTRWVLVIWIAAVIAGPIYRAMHSHNEIEFLYGYLACFDAIAMGCITAVLVGHVKIGNRTRALLQLASLAGMAVIFLGAGIDSVPVWGTSFMALGAAGFLFAEGGWKHVKDISETRSLADRLSLPVGWFGRHSYELYLFHIVLLAGMRSVPLMKTLSPNLKLVGFTGFLAASAGVAWAIARWYSEPLNRDLRARLAGKRAAA
jgi:peptidoglycan/LPS O-acetylase OafA/YrhL